jgi:hypothetical protein
MRNALTLGSLLFGLASIVNGQAPTRQEPIERLRPYQGP